jgi:WD40 repeat protein
MFSLGEHNSEGRCICAVDDEHIHPECPLPCHSGNVSWVAFAPDGKHVMSGSADHVVKIWNVETRAEVTNFLER